MIRASLPPAHSPPAGACLSHPHAPAGRGSYGTRPHTHLAHWQPICPDGSSRCRHTQRCPSAEAGRQHCQRARGSSRAAGGVGPPRHLRAEGQGASGADPQEPLRAPAAWEGAVGWAALWQAAPLGDKVLQLPEKGQKRGSAVPKSPAILPPTKEAGGPRGHPHRVCCCPKGT